MPTISNEDLRGIHESICDAMPCDAVFYCVIFNPDDGEVVALDNADDPQDIREVARDQIDQELRTATIARQDALQR